MDILLSFLTASACLLVLLLIRNDLIYRIRTKAIDEIFRYKDWKEKQELLLNPTYFMMVLDLTKWSFKTFYPEHYSRLIAREIMEHDE